MGLPHQIPRPIHSRAADESFLSVITPVYNGAKYLAECVESVLAQTHANWAHVIVDNASTDATPDIAESYARRDSRITLVRYEDFVDVNDSFNRAFALTRPESTWCKPVLADDWIYPECLQRMLAVAGKSDSIGLVSAYQRWGDQVLLASLPYDEDVFVGAKVLARIFLEWINVTGNPSAVMVRSNLVLERDAFYDRRLEHSDTDAAFRTLVDRDLGFVHQVLTYARRQGDTLTERAIRVGTNYAENLLYVVHYGRMVLDPVAYRLVLRAQIRRYALFQLKEFVRPSRLMDTDFLDFHRRAVENLREANGDGDQEVERLADFVECLLSRQVLSDRMGPRRAATIRSLLSRSSGGH
jgi:glycosyltransferase involved in cell wall biosynthesis